jgi:glycosyltransferase involved in cell wall biosynthesis
VLDTGDAAYELAKSTGSHRGARLVAVRLGERLALALASHVVVRGRAHLELLPGKPATFVPDVAPPAAAPLDGTALRRELDLEGRFVAGLVGSLVWAPRLERCYGWDLVEALPGASADVVALIVGDGSGQDWLERRARELGVLDRCRFVGRQPSDRVAEYIAAMDVGTSTQTNDPVGRVRTTGKLPLYLACGRPVVASHVGEAARLLGPLGWTVRYDGTTDPEFPARLAAKLNDWPRDGDATRTRREAALELAAREFGTERWGSLLADVLSAGRD